MGNYPKKIRGLSPLPFTLEVGKKHYRIGIEAVTTEKNAASQEKPNVFIIGASGLDPVVTLRKDFFLADTFFFTEKEATATYRNGFQVGDQETGEAEPEVREIVNRLIEAGNAIEVSD